MNRKADIPETAVLLSTWNGERFLREQIDSILNQEGVRLTLYIRDDGSSDSTPSIIREYEARDSRVVFVNPGQRENLGVSGSFMTLLRYALRRNREAEYFSFSDQDDVWNPDKLRTACRMLEEIGPNRKGRLYFSNKVIVDQDLNVIQEEHMRIQDDLFDAFWPNVAAGCTMVADRTLASIAARHNPPSGGYHDAWLLRIARIIGSGIVFDRGTEGMLHRQHGNNAFGFDDGGLYHDDAPVWKKILPSLKKAPDHKKQKLIRYIRHYYGDMIPKENRPYVDAVLDYHRNPLSALRLILCPMAWKRGRRLYLVWTYRVLFRQI